MTQMKKRGGRAKGYFPKVAAARQLLVDEAEWWYGFYKQVAIDSLAAQDFITAEKTAFNILSHMPEDDETGTLLGVSIDKNREPDQKGPQGPSIQIGLALGGMPTQEQQALPPANIIDLVAIESEKNGKVS